MSKTTDQIIIDKAFADKEVEANEPKCVCGHQCTSNCRREGCPCECETTTEQCFCQSYFDDNNVLQDCTCGKCSKNNETDEDDDSADEAYERERSDESYQQSSYGYLME